MMTKDNQDKLKTQDSEKPWEKQFTDDRDSDGNLSRVATRQKSRGTTILMRVVWTLIALFVIVPVVANALASNSGSPDKDKIAVESTKKKAKPEEEKSQKNQPKKAETKKESVSSSASTSSAASQSSTPASSSSSRPAESSSSSEPVTGTYTVKGGDNAYRIALNHGMTLDEFYQMNGMGAGSALTPGMVVKVK